MKKFLLLILASGWVAGIIANSNTEKPTIWQKAKTVVCSKPVKIATILGFLGMGGYGAGYIGFTLGEVVGHRGRGAQELLCQIFGYIDDKMQLGTFFLEREPEYRHTHLAVLRELMIEFSQEQQKMVDITLCKLGDCNEIRYTSENNEVQSILKSNSPLVGLVRHSLEKDGLRFSCIDKGLIITANSGAHKSISIDIEKLQRPISQN